MCKTGVMSVTESTPISMQSTLSWTCKGINGGTDAVCDTATKCYKNVTTCLGTYNSSTLACAGIGNPYTTAITLNYTMAGGGASTNSAGGGSTALYTSSDTADVIIAKGVDVRGTVTVVSGAIQFKQGTTLYAYVGGGGGAGYNCAGGGAGWFGGNSSRYDTGGTGGNNSSAGTQANGYGEKFKGGHARSSAYPNWALGGTGMSGGAGHNDTVTGGCGGGGGFGGGGGGFYGSAGGSNGANGGGTEGGSGANNWASATVLPSAAGGYNGRGGNAGLIILNYITQPALVRSNQKTVVKVPKNDIILLMSKSHSIFICQSCGASYNKWAGKCEACGNWNTLIEEKVSQDIPKGLNRSKNSGSAVKFVSLKNENKKEEPRRLSGIAEFDRVLGGGLVIGSATLVGGDPGIGKSTILLQIACNLSGKHKVAYISGEEATEQIRGRALRLGLENADCALASETSVRDIAAAIDNNDAPDIVIIDSIQTMFIDSIDSAPGTVTQVRTATQELIRIAKKRGISLIIVGHVTKDGAIAGPRVLEHMVDTVLYLEGDRGHQFRVLRGVKNRFGATDEIGVFEMTEKGLMEVPNPSALFLSDRRDDMTGAAVFAGLEGTRPILVEIQALVASSSYGTPRRAVVGWDASRLAMILAVLESRCGIKFGNNDVYLNIAGGFRVSDPSADLAVAAALLSSLTGVPVPGECVIFGEIGLSGEIRRVNQADIRIKEAEKLGFSRALMPHMDKKGKANLKITEIRKLNDLLPLFNE